MCFSEWVHDADRNATTFSHISTTGIVSILSNVIFWAISKIVSPENETSFIFLINVPWQAELI